MQARIAGKQMTETHKTIREGVDTAVAAKSAMTRAKYDPSSAGSTHQARPPSAFTASFNRTVRSLAKRLLARLKPVVHPVLFRLRNYLNQPLMEQMSRLETQLLHLEQQVQLHNPGIAPANPVFTQLDRIEQYAFASARRVAVNCGPGEILVRSEVGYILCSSSDHAVLACLLEAGELEKGTRLLIQRFLKPNDVFIDVGANLGMHTLAAAHAMQGRGRIIAFEPFETTQRLLEKSVWMNGFSELVEIHQAAVSNHDGHQPLYLGATSGHNSLYHLAPASTPSSRQSVEVPLVRLDSVVPESTPVALIKIDVEGAELDVLESARTIIAGNPSIALIVEFGFSHLARTGHTTKDWLAAFQDLGLEYRAIDAHTGQLEQWTDAQLEAVDSVNLFFARPQSAAWSRAGVRHEQ